MPVSHHKESVRSLLESLELLKETRSVSIEQLFHSACDLFKGSELTWLIINRNNFHNSDKLVEILREDFLTYCYAEDFEREMYSRTQDGTN